MSGHGLHTSMLLLAVVVLLVLWLRDRGGMSAASRVLQHRGTSTLTGAALIAVSGLLHLILTPEHFEEAVYLGLLFVANFVGTSVAASGIYWGQRWGWLLGALIAGGAFVLYLVSGTVGLPGVHEGRLLEPVGVLAKTLEALFLVLCGFELFAGFGRRALTGGIVGVLVAAGLATGLILLGAAPGVHHEEGPAQQHDDDRD